MGERQEEGVGAAGGVGVDSQNLGRAKNRRVEGFGGVLDEVSGRGGAGEEVAGTPPSSAKRKKRSGKGIFLFAEEGGSRASIEPSEGGSHDTKTVWERGGGGDGAV